MQLSFRERQVRSIVVNSTDAPTELSLSEAARRLNRSASQVRRLVDADVLVGRRTPYGRLVDAGSVDAYLLAKRAPDAQESVS